MLQFLFKNTLYHRSTAFRKNMSTTVWKSNPNNKDEANFVNMMWLFIFFLAAVEFNLTHFSFHQSFVLTKSIVFNAYNESVVSI